ncbi:MAG TPA: hypothetical protein VGK73_10085 [Polyangiaceae bacterium]
MTLSSALVLTLGLTAPAPAVAATQGAVAVDPGRSPGNARMTDGTGKQLQALELEATLSPSVLFADAANPSYQSSYNRWGFAATGVFTYRPRYFLQPHMEVGYAHLASGESHLPDGFAQLDTDLPGGTMEQSLWCWTFSPGVTFPFWRFRAIAGIGFAIAFQENVFRGETNQSSQLGLLQRLALSFDALKTDRMRLAAQIEYQDASGLKLKWLTFGVSFRGDFVQWD